ncbi:MAG: glycosyltransferase family 39 protein [Candidatus Shapirobacteria bacterium]|nr:glycosyltransferase family 39 protein [Candidatus Shapirobacteria bacterium]
MIKKNILKIAKVFVFLMIVLLALFLRKKNYAEIPIPGQSADEYSYSWVGLSLIETGMPVGISGIEGYKNSLFRYVNVDRFFQTVSTEGPLEINYPWMDHPPLLGLITGGYAYLSGARIFEDTTTFIIRKPIILISTVSVALLMVYCWINFGFITSVIGGLLYATTPLVVLSGRMIQAENAIIPCLLVCMISLFLYLKKKGDGWLLIAALFSGIATLFKLTGVICYLLVFITLLIEYKGWNKKFVKDFSFFLIIALPISFLFVIYGAVYGLDNFKNILFSNYNRFYGIGANSVLELIRNQRLTQHKFLPEASIIGGWIIFWYFLTRKSNNLGTKITVFAILAYLIVYVFFGSQPYGWYTFPFWPLLMIISAKFFGNSLVKGKNLLPTFLLLIMILGANIANIINVFEFQPFANWWRIGISLLLLGLVLKPVFKNKFLFVWKMLIILIIAAIIYTNIKYLAGVNLDFWWQNIS